MKLVMVTAFIAVFVSAASVCFANDNLYEKIHESFLKDDYAAVDRLSRNYLSSGSAPSHREDVLYLQALSLLKLNRSFEARVKLKELENSFRVLEDKASASASVGDSYFYEGNKNAAFEAYRETLKKYPASEQTLYLRDQLLKINPRYLAPLKQMGVEVLAIHTVQVGSFAREQNARLLKEELVHRQFDAYIEKDSENRMYRVRVGKLDSQSEASQLASRLKKEGYPTKICP